MNKPKANFIPDSRLIEVIRGYIANHSTDVTRPDMSNEHHLLALAKLIESEVIARRPLTDLENEEIK